MKWTKPKHKSNNSVFPLGKVAEGCSLVTWRSVGSRHFTFPVIAMTLAVNEASLELLKWRVLLTAGMKVHKMVKLKCHSESVPGK